MAPQFLAPIAHETEPEAAGTVQGEGQRRLSRIQEPGIATPAVIVLTGTAYLLVAAADRDSRGVPATAMCGFVAWIVSLAVQRTSALRLGDARSNVGVSAMIAYGVFAVVGRLGVYVNRTVAGLDFGHARDDSYFFFRALDLAAGDTPDQLTPFDLLGGAVATVSNALQGDTQLLDLLPTVWMLGAISVAIAIAIAEQVGRKPASAVAILSIVANAVFVDTCTHYYRDAAMLVFLTACLLFALNGRWILGTGAALGAWWIRFANGMIGVLAVFLFSLSRSKIAQRNPRIVAMVGVIPCVVTIAVGSGTQLDFGRDRSIASIAVERREQLRDFYPEGGGPSLTARLYYAGPAGMVMAGVAAVLAPVTFRTPIQNIVYETVYERKVGRGLFLFNLLEWITIMLWPAVGPPLLIGCRSAIRGAASHRVLITLFLVTLIGNISISLQPRHRCGFIVLFPALISLVDRREDGRSLRLLVLAFVLSIAILNLVQATLLS